MPSATPRRPFAALRADLLAYNASTLEPLPKLSRPRFNREWGRGEGWGMTDDGDVSHTLYLSDGSRSIFELDARTMKLRNSTRLPEQPHEPPVFSSRGNINELECARPRSRPARRRPSAWRAHPWPAWLACRWVPLEGRPRGSVFFNVWQSDMVGQYDVEVGCGQANSIL